MDKNGGRKSKMQLSMREQEGERERQQQNNSNNNSSRLKLIALDSCKGVCLFEQKLWCVLNIDIGSAHLPIMP